MKKIFLFTMIITGLIASAQTHGNNNKANSFLEKVSAKLNAIQRVSYKYTQETKYFADNYYHLRNAGLYVEYIAKSPIGLRFKATDEQLDFVYNGDITMRLQKDMTIDSAAGRTVRQMESNSYLYHSLSMLRNILPLVIKNDSIQKTVYDTLIGQQQLYCIEMEGPQMYFGLFSGINRFTAKNLRRPYYLLVDKKTLLPQQFATKFIRGTDDRDFIRVVYSNIDLAPSQLPANAWDYTAYMGEYKPYIKPEKKPVIAIGALIIDFTLPSYTPVAVQNISLKQYAGKVVLLDFWFKSCGPCMEAMPHYKELQNKMGKDFQLLTINVMDPLDDIKFFYNKHQPNYPMMYNGDKLFAGMGLESCPSSVLLDKSGKVVKVFFGFNEDLIGKSIQQLL